MQLTESQLKLIQAKSTQAKRLRYLLAQLGGENVQADLQGFVLQANATEMQCWLSLQQLAFNSRGQDDTLQQLIEKARLEYQTEQAFEQGRKAAYALPAAEVAEFGQQWRESKNPYLQEGLFAQEVARAWTAGFQSALDIIAGESW